LVEDIDAAIIIQKQRWIEAAGVEEYRIGPVALNGWRGDDVSVAGGVTQNHCAPRSKSGIICCSS
jgi:hypothetical protein